MTRSTRQSFGLGMRDVSSTYQLRSSSASRAIRRSSNVGASTDSESGKKDRRALLEEWRRQVRERDELNETSGSKRQRNSNEINSRHAPPLPPDGSRTALERIRLRREQQQEIQQQQKDIDDQQERENIPPGLKNDATSPPHDSNIMSHYPTRIKSPKLSTISGASRRSESTSRPSRRRSRSLSLGGPLRNVHNNSVVEPQSELTKFQSSFSSTNENQQKCQTLNPNEQEKVVDAVEGAGLRSRIQEMQQRINQLEREKMDLTKSKAPLEARFRQKEDAWMVEKSRLVQELDELRKTVKLTDDALRGSELTRSALEEERNRLKYEALRASVALPPGHENDASIEQSDKLKEAEDDIRALRLDKVSLEADLDATQRELRATRQNIDRLEEELSDIQTSDERLKEAEIQLQVLTTEHMATAAQLHAVCADLAQTKSSAEAELAEVKKHHKETNAALRFELSVLKNKQKESDDGVALTDVTNSNENLAAVLKAKIEERDAKIAELEAQVSKGEQQRRIMHNRIQELRGNIRVFVRTRPHLPSDNVSSNGPPQSCIDVLPNGEEIIIEDPRNGGHHNFSFDKVFPPSSGQDSVFAEVSDFVQSALDGYNVCLFSYGQTGSGKTHTMQGSGSGVMRGIIPRAVEQILSQASALSNQKWTFQMSASFLEIYNENLVDLLTANGRKDSSTRTSSKLSIKRNARGKNVVDGLSSTPIDASDVANGMAQLDALVASAARSRSVARTAMNSQSSRSHSVFMLHLQGKNTETGTTVDGSLNLCDLAGSERLDRSGAGSDAKRLRETQAINKSLSCLADVFAALATGSKHVPFRNSRLTYLLQDCLSGDGKALMLVNLSPTMESHHESLCSLRFAQRVNQVELGKPIKHVKYTHQL